MVNAPARHTAPHIAVIDGKPTTTSRDIAENFGKRHDNLLRAIASLDCSPEFNALNFEAVEYIDGKGEKRTEYRITRDGFAFLCMGFTGTKAAQWKEKYINTFNQMAEKVVDDVPEAKKLPAAKTLSLPAPRLSAEALAAIDARAGQIAGSTYAEVRQWLLGQVLAGCINPDGTARPNFANTLAGADFAAFTTHHANKHLETIAKVLQFIQGESGALLARVQLETNRLKGQP